jgi:hypothetical protein
MKRIEKRALRRLRELVAATLRKKALDRIAQLEAAAGDGSR